MVLARENGVRRYGGLRVRMCMILYAPWRVCGITTLDGSLSNRWWEPRGNGPFACVFVRDRGRGEKAGASVWVWWGCYMHRRSPLSRYQPTHQPTLAPPPHPPPPPPPVTFSLSDRIEIWHGSHFTLPSLLLVGYSLYLFPPSLPLSLSVMALYCTRRVGPC